MPSLKSLISKTFNNLLVLSREPNNSKGRAEWLCRCACGVECIQSSRNLLGGWARSCGCLRRIDDIVDTKIGRLLVLGLSEGVWSGRTKCRCQCDCGSIVHVEAASLRFGHSLSCGCIKKDRFSTIGLTKKVDLVGKTYGDLLVLEYTKREGSNLIHWKCLCICGKTTFAVGQNLKRGTVSSCGCRRFPDLMGNRFGLLTVLKQNGARRNGQNKRQNLWLCLCDCGKEVSIRTSYLKRGITISCGCLKGGNKIMHRSAKIRSATRCYSHTRRARVEETGGVFTSQDVANRFRWQRGRCAMPWCRIKLTDHNKRIDHIIPLSPRRREGAQLLNLNDRRNTQLTCDPCNAEKSDKDPLTHARDKGFLL